MYRDLAYSSILFLINRRTQSSMTILLLIMGKVPFELNVKMRHPFFERDWMNDTSVIELPYSPLS